MRSVRSTSTSAVKQMSAFDRQAVGARGAGYGLDAELARKREAGYDHRAEDEVRVSVLMVISERELSSSWDRNGRQPLAWVFLHVNSPYNHKSYPNR